MPFSEFPDAVIQFADIVIQLHDHFYHVRALEVQEGIDISAVFDTKFLVSYVNAFCGCQISPLCNYQGCGVGVEIRVRVGWSRPFCLESKSELESVKFCRLRLRPGVSHNTTRQETVILAERVMRRP